MKNVGILLSFFFSVTHLCAQISITNSTFPVAGDTLTYVIEGNVSQLNVGSTNGPQVWDFSNLKSGVKFNEIYKTTSSGSDAASFPEANLLLNVEGQEQYLKSSNSKIEGLGLGGANDFIDVPIVIKYSKKPTLRVAPLEFINSTSSNSEFLVDIGANTIPEAIRMLIPINFDSIRIQFANSAKGIVDAYGKLKMQNKEFDVLREKVETNTDTKVFLKIFGFWIDPLPLLGGNIPPGFENLLGRDTTITYNYYTNTQKQILVSAEFDTKNTLQQVTVADFGGLISSTQESSFIGDIQIYPNPASEILTLQTNGMKEGGYLLTISDISGRIVYGEPVFLFSDFQKEINVSNMDKGIYIMSIRDKFNTFTWTSKFIVK